MVTKKSAVIGEGSYGCVLRPQPRCKKTKLPSTTKTVGKVIKKKNAEIELRISALLKSIPGWENYYVVQEEDNCEPANFKEMQKEYSDDCKLFQDDTLRINNLTQIVSKYGGKDLTVTTSNFDYMGTLKHVLIGIEKLQAQGICHYDLKDNNMVSDEHGVVRLIDFGSAFVGDSATDTNVVQKIFHFLPEYNTFSPELSAQHGLYHVKERPHSLKELYHDSIYKKSSLKLMETILGVPREQSKDKLVNFWADYYKEHGDTEAGEFFRTYWRAWDTWAVGVIFLKILSRSLLNPSFVEKVWKPKGTVLKEVLRGLLAVDPRERLSPGAALKMIGT